MAFVKVTDGCVSRYFDTSTPKGKHLYKELVNNNTGYNTVVTREGTAKEFTEEEVKARIEAARTASKKKEQKAVINTSRAVVED